MNQLTTITPADTFRAKSSGLLVEAANMPLHGLVDEFLRLTTVMDADFVTDDENPYGKLGDAGELAARERKVVIAATRARFGLHLEPFDRVSDGVNYAPF